MDGQGTSGHRGNESDRPNWLANDKIGKDSLLPEPTDVRLPNSDVLTHRPERSHFWKRVGLYFLLLGLTVCTCSISTLPGDWPAWPPSQTPRDHLANAQHYLTIIALASLLVAMQFFVFGCLLYGVYYLYSKQYQEELLAVRRWPVVLLGLGLTVGLCGMRIGQLPGLAAIMLPGLGFLFGVWIASNCLRGVRATMRLVPKLAAIMIAVVGLGVVTFYLITSNEPSAFEAPVVTAKEKARLARAIDDREDLEQGRQRMKLSERDVNLLMAAACEQLAFDAKAHAHLRRGAVGLDLSVALPIGAPWQRYLNLRADGQFAIEDSQVVFQPDRLEIGKLAIPSTLLESFGSDALALAKADPRAGAVLATIDRLRFTDQQVEAVYHAKRLRRELKLAFHDHLGETQAVIDATAIHSRHLVDTAAGLPGGDEQFSACLQTAFTLAQQRCLRGRDPVVENRAAILALAIVLGHERMEAFVGNVTDSRTKVRAKAVRGEVTVRGRHDWTRHFFVSAGLALTFNASLSDDAGLFKEEADSSEGGSGFSFSDLLADRAGVRFANAATRDRAAAQQMQALLTAPFSLDDVFPAAADLPEGLREAELQRQYGSINGEGYQQLVTEIERRLDTCRALTKSPRK